MLPKLQYNFTNWVDGMKIHRQHFMDSENALLDQIRDVQAISLHAFNYGLLHPLSGEKSALDCTTATNQSRKFKIVVTHCRAVTAGGCRIEILPGIHPELISDNDLAAPAEEHGSKPAAGSYFAVISVDPYNRQPFGAAAAEEYPPRNANSVPAYKLSLVGEDEINSGSLGAFHLPIARFVLRNGELVRDAEYIPPCATITAHPGTKQIYNTISERLNRIQEYCAEIIRKVVDGGQNSALAQNVKKVCESCIWHISAEFFFFRMMYRQQSPVYVANTIVQLATKLSVSMNMMSLKEKEELLQYCFYWNEISPGKMEEVLATVVNADYEHEDIYGFYQPLLHFLKVWDELLEKLKDLKLIGQKTEKFDFGGRTMETSKDKGKGKFTIFD